MIKYMKSKKKILDNIKKILKEENSFYDELSEFIKKNKYKQFIQKYEEHEKKSDILLHDVLLNMVIDIDKINSKENHKFKNTIYFLMEKSPTKIGLSYLYIFLEERFINFYKKKIEEKNNHEITDKNKEIIFSQIITQKDFPLFKAWIVNQLVPIEKGIFNAINSKFDLACEWLKKEDYFKIPSFQTLLVESLFTQIVEKKINHETRKDFFSLKFLDISHEQKQELIEKIENLVNVEDFIEMDIPRHAKVLQAQLQIEKLLETKEAKKKTLKI